MKNRRSNWQITVSVILIFAVWFGALPVFGQIKQDGKGVGNKVVTELPSKEKRWALIVGIDKYERDVSTLQGAVNDARALKNVLVNYAGFPENQVVLLTSDAAEADDLPKRENILSALGDLSQRVPPDGLLLFSFSGHGVSVGNDAFLIPSNGRITKNLSLLRSLSINVKDIQEAIQEIKVKQVLMLLDACRNEPGKGDTPNVLTDAYKEGFSFDVVNSEVKAFATLFATSVGERAFEFYDKESKQFRGYFSHAVEEALKGKAANEKGEVTLSNLINYLETTVPKKVKYDKGETQIPSANFSETYKANQLILAVANKTNSVSEIITNTDTNNIPIKNPTLWSKILPMAKLLSKYDRVGSFFEGLVRVDLNGKYGFIDETGKEVIPLKYDQLSNFSEGLIEVRLKGKQGYIDKNGKEIIPIGKYDYIGEFSEGLAWVGLNGKRGFIDKTGKEVIPIKYDTALSFSEGLAPAKLNGKYSLIDKTGNEIIPLKYVDVWYFSEGLARAKLNGKWGFIDKTGKEVIPLKYDDSWHFYKGLASVKSNGKWGSIDKTGKEIIPFKYDYISAVSEGLVIVRLNGKLGFIDKTGKEIIPIGKYDTALSFSEGLIEVKLNRKYGFIDKTGKEVIQVKYDSIWCHAFRKEGFFGVILNGKKGFVDIYGNEYFDF